MCVEGVKGKRVLTAWFPWSVHGDFDGTVVSGYLRWAGEHCNGQGEALAW